LTNVLEVLTILIALMMEAISTSEMSVSFYQVTGLVEFFLSSPILNHGAVLN
jgi:hypothetical protein